MRFLLAKIIYGKHIPIWMPWATSLEVHRLMQWMEVELFVIQVATKLFFTVKLQVYCITNWFWSSGLFCFRGSDSESWKEFISKPSLPYVLRILTGLCRGHDSTQVFFLVHKFIFIKILFIHWSFPVFSGIEYKDLASLVLYSLSVHNLGNIFNKNLTFCQPYCLVVSHLYRSVHILDLC